MPYIQPKIRKEDLISDLILNSILKLQNIISIHITKAFPENEI